MSQVQIMGSVAPGYESVRELFKKAFERGSEDKAQLCVYVEGHRVVDLWAFDPNQGSQYSAQSLQNVFSSTKTLAALCIACMVDKGLLDYQEKVVAYWPEFGQNGKEYLTLADILRHEGGLKSFDESLQLDDLSTDAIKNNAIGKIIERQCMQFPAVERGTNREYHAITRGWILNEIFRRVEPQGRTIGQYLREEISQPLEADAYIGVQDSQLENMADIRVWPISKIFLASCVPRFLGRSIEPNLWFFLKLFLFLLLKRFNRPRAQASKANAKAKGKVNPPPVADGWPPGVAGLTTRFNDARYRQGEMPSANGSCSARGLARIAACIVNEGELDGVRIISEEALRKMHDQPIRKKDSVLADKLTEMSQGGVNFYKIYDDEPSFMHINPNDLRSGFVGWQGLGGSVFQWHPELRIGFAFAPTQLHWFDLNGIRSARYQAEVVQCVRRLKKKSE